MGWSACLQGGDGSNPFVLPSDEEVFKMREDERRRKREVSGKRIARPFASPAADKVPRGLRIVRLFRTAIS